MAQDEHLIRRVGAGALALIALAIGFFVFVYGRIEWGSHVRIRVYFHHTGGLHEGAAFVVAGRTVGQIEAIALVPRGASKLLGDEEGVVATVAIDANMADQLDASGDVFVSARGALSDRYLELGPAASPGPRLHEGIELVGRDPPSLDRVLQRTWDNLMTASRFASEIRPEWDALRVQLDEVLRHLDPTGPDATTVVPSIARMSALIDDASAISDQVKQARDVGLGGDAGRAKLGAIIDEAHDVVASTRAQLDKLGKGADVLQAAITALRGRLDSRGQKLLDEVQLAIDRIKAGIDKLDPLLAQVDALRASLARGEGSMMKLANDPEFPEDAKELGKIMKRQPWKVMDRPVK